MCFVSRYLASLAVEIDARKTAVELASFKSALLPNRASEGREGKLYRWTKDGFIQSHKKNCLKYSASSCTGSFLMMVKMYGERDYLHIHDL